MISTDLSGQRFGKLTVLERDYETQRVKKSKDSIWKCQCDCGNIISVRRPNLIQGATKSCGCLYSKIAKEKQDNAFLLEIGKTYNDLTILKDTGKRNDSRQRIVECKCSCGRKVEYDLPHIKNGHYKSCGHHKQIKDIIGLKFDKLTVIKILHEQIPSDPTYECICDCGKICNRRYSYLTSNKIKSCGGCVKKESLIGEKFGLLTIIQEAENNKVLCKCDCGNEIVVNKSNLKNNHTKSCGCIKSFGEYQIEKFLRNNKIKYEKEYTFKDLKDNDFLRFDFAIFNENNNLIKLIECNGEQHYDKNNLLYNEKLALHDKMKIEYCYKNNIKLIIIDYVNKQEFSEKFLYEKIFGEEEE